MQPTCPSSAWLSLWPHAAHKAPEGAPARLRWTVPSGSTRRRCVPRFQKLLLFSGGDRGVSSVQGAGGEWTLSLICATLCHVGPKAALCSASPKISFKGIFISIWCSPLTQSPGSNSIQVVVWKFMLSHALIPLRPKLPTILPILPQISVNVRVPTQPAHDS